MKVYIQKINSFDTLELVTKCFLIYLLIFSHRLNLAYLLPLVLVLLISIISNNDFFKKPAFWVIVSALFLPNFISMYYSVANHFFLMFYLVILFTIASFYYSNREDILKQNAKWILAIIMGFAVIQKLLTPQFMNGESISFLTFIGGLFKFPLILFPELQPVIKENFTSITEVSSFKNPINLKSPFSFFKEFVQGFTYLTIIVEVIFVGLLFIKNEKIKNVFFVLFVGALIITREESGFASLLCLLLVMQLGKNSNSIFRGLYILLFTICLGLIISNWGAH